MARGVFRVFFIEVVLASGAFARSEVLAAERCDATGADSTAIAAARAAIDAACDCDGSTHAAYGKCATRTLAARVKGGLLSPACRREVLDCARHSTCGRVGAVACCRAMSNGRSGFIARSAAMCFEHRPAGCVGPGRSVCDACNTQACFVGCGDGIVETGEECEPPGTPSCDAQCRPIHACGNGVVDLRDGEECEPPGTATCDAQCHFIHNCGNGVIEPGEECDGQPGCSATCQLERSVCCAVGDACIDAIALDGFSEYDLGKSCFLGGGTGAFGVCTGSDPCPPPAPPTCRIGSCGDEPISPLTLCCQHPNGTCTGGTVTTAAAVGAFGCTPAPFDFPPQGDIDHLLVGTCEPSGHCTPLAP
jgi:hypothetical protein